MKLISLESTRQGLSKIQFLSNLDKYFKSYGNINAI